MVEKNIIANPEQFTEEYALKLRKQHSNRIPVLIWEIVNQEIGFTKSTRRFMVQQDTTLGQLMYILRKRINLNSDEGLFVFVGNPPVMVSNAETIGIIHNKYQENGFLKLTLSKESTFG